MHNRSCSVAHIRTCRSARSAQVRMHEPYRPCSVAPIHSTGPVITAHVPYRACIVVSTQTTGRAQTARVKLQLPYRACSVAPIHTTGHARTAHVKYNACTDAPIHATGRARTAQVKLQVPYRACKWTVINGVREGDGVKLVVQVRCGSFAFYFNSVGNRKKAKDQLSRKPKEGGHQKEEGDGEEGEGKEER